MSEYKFTNLQQTRLDLCAYRLDTSIAANVFVDALEKYEGELRREVYLSLKATAESGHAQGVPDE